MGEPQRTDFRPKWWDEPEAEAAKNFAGHCVNAGDEPECVCGHGRGAHEGHTHLAGTPEPTHCSQGCWCLKYRPKTGPADDPEECVRADTDVAMTAEQLAAQWELMTKPAAPDVPLEHDIDDSVLF
jgi:hypothetical protein